MWVHVGEERVDRGVKNRKACEVERAEADNTVIRTTLALVWRPEASHNSAPSSLPSCAFLVLCHVFPFARSHPLQRYFHLYAFRTCPPHFAIIGLHSSARRNALTKMTMPAMSPTMTEGGISVWKKAEGETFSSGDVLLEIVCLSLLNSSQRVTNHPCRKPTKRSLTSRHKRMAFSRRSSYVAILWLCSHFNVYSTS